MRKEVLCVGEVLWDAMPLGLFLGGAPFNVACHLHALGEEVAWDRIRCTDELVSRASEAAAIVFGTLAQREAVSRETIQALCRQGAALKVLDVNLCPPFVRRAVAKASLEAADVVKLNTDELKRMQRWFDLPEEGVRASVEALADAFDCRVVCVTRGAGGAVLWKEGAWFEHPGYSVEAKDMVGAGDAFLAALLAGLLNEIEGEKLLDLANRLGAYVATQFGGTPTYEIETLEAVRKMSLPESEGAG